MSITRRTFVLLLCLFFFVFSPKAQALLGIETTSSANILSQSANHSCLAWRPIGICVWMTCVANVCTFNTSVKVKHYIPDAVVSTYPVTGESPWLETRILSQPNALAQSGGSNTEGSTVNNETALLFKHADVIGSPGSLWINFLANTGYMCNPGTTPYLPYMISTLNHAWRNPTLETPWSLANILRNVNFGIASWGSLYPRTGFVFQGHDYKAGAVTAQRAGDITTRSNQPHIYQSILANPSPGYWPPGALVEGNVDTGKWQQLVPALESGSCRVFADKSDVTSFLTDPFFSRRNDIAGYAFNLWRPYRCCEKEGQTLFLHTGN